MHTKGHAFDIQGNVYRSMRQPIDKISLAPDTIINCEQPIFVSMTDFLEAINKQIQSNRDTELQGMYLADIVSDIFLSTICALAADRLVVHERL